MPLSGDLSTLDLSDLLQNLEANERTGTLTVHREEGPAHVAFRKGRIASFAAAGRPTLAEALVAAGMLSEPDLEAALKRRKRFKTRKTLVEVLAHIGLVAVERVKQMAQDLLVDDMCDLVIDGGAGGEFEFHEGAPPPRMFDPEERALELAVPTGPLVLEAARRADHWNLIRRQVPSDSAYFLARSDTPPQGVRDADLARTLLRRCDGTRTVREVLAPFLHKRFEAYELLAECVRTRALRPLETNELVRLSRQLAPRDPARAREVVRRGLQSEAHSTDLLAEEAKLAEKTGDVPGAVAAHKRIAHLMLDRGDFDLAQSRLEDARRLDPSDTSVWERTFAMALEQGRIEDAIHDGLELVALHRGPGLHSRARELLDRMVGLDPESVELRVELARSQVDCGDLAGAVAGLERHARMLIGREKYVQARAIYDAILRFDPANGSARGAIEQIDAGIFAERRERRRRILRRVGLAAASLVLGTAFAYEGLARVQYAHAVETIGRDRLIELWRYEEAMQLVGAVAEAYPLSLTALYDVHMQLEVLKEKEAFARRANDPGSAPRSSADR